jgi:hypothetical protein
MFARRIRSLPLQQLLKVGWALPCSLVGLGVAAPILLCGGKVTLVSSAVAVTWAESGSRCRTWTTRLPFRALTLGHVILAVTSGELHQLLPHELVHVRQYERWGMFFFPAYAASSMWQLLIGRRAYWDNWFEVQARERSAWREAKR